MQEGSWIDLVVIGIIGLSVLLGVWQGLLSSVAGIVAFIIAFLVARSHGTILISPLHALLEDSAFAPFISVGGVFLLTFIAIKLFARMASAGLRRMSLGGLDYFGGGVFGLVRGGFFSMLFVLVLTVASVNNTPAWGQSRTVPLLGATLKILTPLMGEYRHLLVFDKSFRPRIDNLAESKLMDKATAGQGADEKLNRLVERASPVDFSATRAKVQDRNKEYDEVMEELRQFVAIRGHELGENVHPEASSVEEAKRHALCMLGLGEGKNCENLGAGELSEADIKRLEAVKKQLLCELKGRKHCPHQVK